MSTTEDGTVLTLTTRQVFLIKQALMAEVERIGTREKHADSKKKRADFKADKMEVYEVYEIINQH